MKKFMSLLTLVIIYITACWARPLTTPAPPILTAEADQFSEVRAHIEQLVTEGEVPSMAVAVARDGEIIWEEGFGLADRENSIPATEHIMYPLASISKPLTATGLMILAEREFVNLDSPINDYLDEVKLQARVGEVEEATVRRIASHTAGLPLHSQHYYDNVLYQPPQIEETIHRYGYLVTAPGERFQYSNLGYGLLGFVISSVSSQSYADFMHNEVFFPLGMYHTSVHQGSGLEEGRAVKYTPGGLEIPPCDSDSPGASAIYSSAHDLIRFAIFHLKNDLPDQKAIISSVAIEEMQRPHPETGPMKNWEHAGSGYGLGWFIGVTEGGMRGVYHSGGTAGVSTTLTLVPEENLAIAVLSNTNSQWPDVIQLEILYTLLPDRLEEVAGLPNELINKPPFMPTPGLIGSWEGFIYTYEGEIHLTLEILESGNIYATLSDQPRTLLQNISYQEDFPKFMNAGGGSFLRGWVLGKLETEDINRGRPYKLALELKLRDNILNGSMIAFSQREIFTGPLAHWVELRKE